MYVLKAQCVRFSHTAENLQSTTHESGHQSFGCGDRKVLFYVCVLMRLKFELLSNFGLGEYKFVLSGLY